jgi:hypothetical protein
MSNHFPRWWRAPAAAVAIACLAVLGVSAPALATPASPAATAAHVGTAPPGVRFTGNTSLIHVSTFHGPRTHLPRSVRTIGRNSRNITLVQSRNWSGYADQACSTCALRFVNASFSAPSINCTGVTTVNETDASFWAGLDGFTSSTVEQTGVLATCDTTSPEYFVWYEMFPNPPVFFTITGFGPGDAVNTQIFFNAATNHYQIGLTDITQNVGFATSQLCPSGSTCKNSSAEIISEAPFDTTTSSFAPLADFGQVFYQGATVTSRNGTHGNLGDEPLWNSFNIAMVNGSHMLASAGPLSNLGIDSAFTDTWHAST